MYGGTVSPPRWLWARSSTQARDEGHSPVEGHRLGGCLPFIQAEAVATETGIGRYYTSGLGICCDTYTIWHCAKSDQTDYQYQTLSV